MNNDRTDGPAIFPRTFRTVAMVVGAIWIIQGMGIADTGSFMDRRPAWAVAGAILFVAGLVSALAQRRRRKSREPAHPGK